MDDRQSQLVRGIIEIYQATATPVGSQALLDQLGLHVSSATVRNDLKELEESGYVFAPHTSAGRAPTARAYRWYVENYLQPTVSPSLLAYCAKTPDVHDAQRTVKSFAKELAQALGQTVFVVFSPEQSYFTGISHLFSQPEFADQGTVQNVTALLDRFDELSEQLYQLIEDKDLHVHIGPGNPFGPHCTILFIPFASTGGTRSLMGVLGPMRMEYHGVIGAMRAAKKYLEQIV